MALIACDHGDTCSTCEYAAEERVEALESALAAAEQRAEEAEGQYDTEMAYTADLEAALACDSCSSPLDHGQVVSRLDVHEAQSRLATAEEALQWAIRELENAANARPEKLIAWMDRLDFDQLEKARAALPEEEGR